MNLEIPPNFIRYKNPIKKIALKHLPQNLVLREKCGFGLPIADWLKDRDGLLPHLSILTKHQIIKKYFIKSEIDKLIKDHLEGKKDYSSILFTIISLVVWYNIFIATQKISCAFLPQK